jgi:hypothetical protein
MPGGDCDDTDPTGTPVTSRCANHKDDNCDGMIDESNCQKPSHDTCLDPLTIDHMGNYEPDTTAASFDFGHLCPHGRGYAPGCRRGPRADRQPQDVDIVAEVPHGAIALGVDAECGSYGRSARSFGANGPSNDRIARLRLRSLAAATHPLYVWSDRDQSIVLHVTYGPPTQPPANETRSGRAHHVRHASHGQPHGYDP